MAQAAPGYIRKTPGVRISRREWIVILLLVLSVVINYVDRSNLGLAMPLLERQFSFSSLRAGELLSAFFWTYALVQLFGLAGELTDRFPVGWVLMLGYLLWSTATAFVGLSTSYATLFALQLVLGLGESVAYPCYSRIFAAMPQEHRGRANAFIDAGTKLGPAAGAFVGGMVLVHWGWRMLFVVFGVGALAWMLPWYFAMPRGGQRAKAGRGDSAPGRSDDRNADSVYHRIDWIDCEDGASAMCVGYDDWAFQRELFLLLPAGVVANVPCAGRASFDWEYVEADRSDFPVDRLHDTSGGMDFGLADRSRRFGYYGAAQISGRRAGDGVLPACAHVCPRTSSYCAGIVGDCVCWSRRIRFKSLGDRSDARRASDGGSMVELAERRGEFRGDCRAVAGWPDCSNARKRAAGVRGCRRGGAGWRDVFCVSRAAR